MSIATDEAEKKYPAPTDVDDPMYKYVEAIAEYPSAKRQGYIAGRTAEPTDAEIDAAARRLYEITHEEEKRWYEMSEAYRNTYREWAEPILTAARKAVTGNE